MDEKHEGMKNSSDWVGQPSKKRNKDSRQLRREKKESDTMAEKGKDHQRHYERGSSSTQKKEGQGRKKVKGKLQKES